MSPDLHRLFVYGTLRPGGSLYAAIERGVYGAIEDCTAKGDIYFVHADYGYPVTDFDGDGTVVGSVLLVDDAALRSARRIELGAGYDERIITVRAPDCQSWQCITYHHPCDYHGDPVPGGDFLKAIGSDHNSWTL